MRFAVVLFLALFVAAANANSFPNYLLPSTQSSANEVDQARKLYEQVMNHLLSRIVSTIDEGGQVKQVRIFNHLKTELGKIDSQAQLISQDVRALGGYIDNQVYNFMEDHPGVDPKVRLMQMLEDHSDLSRMEVLGNASDIDVLITGYSKENFPALNARAREILNSFEMSLDGSSGLSTNLNRTLNTHADVKDYNEQMTRATLQGGATVDFLSFNLATGQLIEPENVKGTIEDYIRGYYRYIETRPGGKVDDLPKQVVRAYRPLSEDPRLSILDPQLLLQQTKKIIADMGTKGISSKALEQFGKMDRNARIAAGNNRLLKGEAGSVEATFFELLMAVRKKYPHAQALTEYVPRYAIGRAAKELPAHLLMSVEQFVQKKTGGTGKMHHGTPSFESALAMARGGFRMSGGMFKQGLAVYGSGAYFSHAESTARSYERGEGYVFAAYLRQDRAVRILNLESLSKAEMDKFLAEIVKEYPGQDPHSVLAEFYGVDLVLRSHIIVLNSAALILPRDEIFLIEGIYGRVSQAQVANSSSEQLSAQLKDYAEYVSLAQVIQARGLSSRFPVISPMALIQSAKSKIETSPKGLLDADTLRNFNRARQFGFYLGHSSDGIDWSIVLSNTSLNLAELAKIAEFELFGNALWIQTIKMIKEKTEPVSDKRDVDVTAALKIFEQQRIWPPSGSGMGLLRRLHTSYVKWDDKYTAHKVFTIALAHQAEWSEYFYEEFLRALELADKDYARFDLLRSLNAHSRIPKKVLERILTILGSDNKAVVNWASSMTGKIPQALWDKLAVHATTSDGLYEMLDVLKNHNEWPDIFWFEFLKQYNPKPGIWAASVLDYAVTKRVRLSSDVIERMLFMIIGTTDSMYKTQFIKVLSSVRHFPNSLFDKAIEVLFKIRDPHIQRQFISMLRKHGWPLMSEHWSHVLKLLESEQGMHHRLVLELLQESKYWPEEIYGRAIQIVKAAKIEPAVKENLAYLLHDRLKRQQSPVGRLEARVDKLMLNVRQRLSTLGEAAAKPEPGNREIPSSDCEKQLTFGF